MLATIDSVINSIFKLNSNVLEAANRRHSRPDFGKLKVAYKQSQRAGLDYLFLNVRPNNSRKTLQFQVDRCTYILRIISASTNVYFNPLRISFRLQHHSTTFENSWIENDFENSSRSTGFFPLRKHQNDFIFKDIFPQRNANYIRKIVGTLQAHV